MAGQAIINLGAANPLQDLILFNDSTDGTLLAVWDITISCMTGGTFTNNTFSVNLGVGKRPPAGTSGPQDPTLGGAPTGDGIMQVDTTTLGSVDTPYPCLKEPGLWQWPHDWPMFYLPSGFSLVCEANALGIVGNIGIELAVIWEWGVQLT